MRKFKTLCFQNGAGNLYRDLFLCHLQPGRENSVGLTVFILEFDDFMVKQPKTTGYEFFILHDIDNIDIWYFEGGSIIRGDQMQILFKLAANLWKN